MWPEKRERPWWQSRRPLPKYEDNPFPDSMIDVDGFVFCGPGEWLAVAYPLEGPEREAWERTLITRAQRR